MSPNRGWFVFVTGDIQHFFTSCFFASPYKNTKNYIVFRRGFIQLMTAKLRSSPAKKGLELVTFAIKRHGV